MEGKFGAVIVAAGSSRRMGGQGSKVLEDLGGQPVLLYSFRTLASSPWVGELAVVCREEDRPQVEALLAGKTDKPWVVAPGGQERQDSVLAGVAALDPDTPYLLIHDGARPFVTAEQVDALCQDAVAYGAATLAVPSKDTCKLSDGQGFVESTPPRDRLMAIQTPQAFEREMYLYAARKAQASGLRYTDDCQLIEAAGGRVKLTAGDYRNLKLTTPEDRVAARATLGKEAKAMRVGTGYDVHRLVEGRKLMLGGVEVPFEKGLLGHSDADVLAHAIADALLGAAALGDIGKLFPDSDPRLQGRRQPGAPLPGVRTAEGAGLLHLQHRRHRAGPAAQAGPLHPPDAGEPGEGLRDCRLPGQRKGHHRGGPGLYRQRGGHGRPGRLPAGILNRLFGAAAGRPFSFAGHGGGPGA